MARATALVILGLTEASIYSRNRYTNCDADHGGTPVDADDVPLANVTTDECETACSNNERCHAFTRHSLSTRRRKSAFGDCYFRSAVNLTECPPSYQSASWETYVQVAPPKLTGIITYHLFEPKYTGLANKDAGDFKGDSGFIFGTFNKWQKGNPEASMESNIIEMSEVNVTGWGEYEECNAPGATEGSFRCPDDAGDYCCTHMDPKNHSHNIPTNHTKDQLPGLEVNPMSLGQQFGFGGFWFSFPRESEGTTWTQKTLRRVAGKCLGDAWRKDAGGCPMCNGTLLDQCVASCIKGALCANGSTDLLQATWDRVFAHQHECPDVAFPSESIVV